MSHLFKKLTLLSLAISVLGSAPAWSGTRYVGTGYYTYPTLRAAYNASSNGDEICILNNAGVNHDGILDEVPFTFYKRLKVYHEFTDDMPGGAVIRSTTSAPFVIAASGCEFVQISFWNLHDNAIAVRISSGVQNTIFDYCEFWTVDEVNNTYAIFDYGSLNTSVWNSSFFSSYGIYAMNANYYSIWGCNFNAYVSCITFLANTNKQFRNYVYYNDFTIEVTGGYTCLKSINYYPSTNAFLGIFGNAFCMVNTGPSAYNIILGGGHTQGVSIYGNGFVGGCTCSDHKAWQKNSTDYVSHGDNSYYEDMWTPGTMCLPGDN